MSLLNTGAYFDADLTDVSAAGKLNIIKWVSPDYESVIENPIPNNEWAQVDRYGWVYVALSDQYQEHYQIVISPDKVTEYRVGQRFDDTNGNTQETSFSFIVPEGWYYRSVDAEAGTMINFIYPLKGAL